MNVFSTCWNSRKHRDGAAICDEILELGFDHIEASHGLPLSKLPGIIQAVDEKRITVAGIHNYCPAPIDVPGDAPDAYQFTSHRPEERARALRLTRESLHTAARLGASYIVLHMGHIHLLRAKPGTRHLEKMARNGELGSQNYAEYKGALIRERQRLAPLYYTRAITALEELLPLAQELSINLAIEGRSHFEQVPSESEMLQIMEHFNGESHIGYWHDFGHIHRKHNLLMLDHHQYLAGLQDHIIGAHVNDVQWPSRDHRVPFSGDVPFHELLPRYFRQDMPLSWEISGSIRREKILEAKEEWDALCKTIPQQGAQR